MRPRLNAEEYVQRARDGRAFAYRFNEASAKRRGIQSLLIVVRKPGAPASMRPRLNAEEYRPRVTICFIYRKTTKCEH